MATSGQLVVNPQNSLSSHVGSFGDMGWSDDSPWVTFQDFFGKWTGKVQKMEENFSTFVQMARKHSQEEFAPLVQIVQSNFLELEAAKRDTEGFMQAMGQQVSQQGSKADWLYQELQKCQEFLREICTELTGTKVFLHSKVEGLGGQMADWGGKVERLGQVQVAFEQTLGHLTGGFAQLEGQSASQRGQWEGRISALEHMVSELQGLVRGSQALGVEGQQGLSRTLDGCRILEGRVEKLEGRLEALETRLGGEVLQREALGASYNDFYAEFVRSSTSMLGSLSEVERQLYEMQGVQRDVGKELEGLKGASRPPPVDLTGSIDTPPRSLVSRDPPLGLSSTRKLKFTGASAGKELELRKIMMIQDEKTPPCCPSVSPPPVTTTPIPALALLGAPYLGMMAGTPPRFSGRVDDWFGFSQEWERHKGFLSMLFGGAEIPNVILLETFGKCLDDISQKLLQQKREENPSLRFSEFWQMLCEEFSGDSSHQQRLAWHQVKLDTTPPLTLEKWKKFEREFELRRGRVNDWTPTEEYDLIFGQLPENYQLIVSREENKKKRDQFWVKLTNLMGVGVLELQMELSELLDGKVKTVEEVPKGFLIDCGEDRLKRRLLGMDGFEINGQKIRVTRAERKLRGSEIFSLVGEDLRIRDEVKRKRGEKSGSTPSSHVSRPSTPEEVPRRSPFRSNREPERVREVVAQPVYSPPSQESYAPLPHYAPHHIIPLHPWVLVWDLGGPPIPLTKGGRRHGVPPP